jgi:hypothetical protein
VRPQREPIKTGSSTPSSLPHPPEWTKGGDHDPIVPADGIVTTTFLHATSASIWYTLHTKHNNGPRALDRTVEEHHYVHGDQIKLVGTEHEPTTRGLPCSCNREWMGSPAVDPLVRCATDLTISGRPGTPNTYGDPPSATSNTKNPNPNGSVGRALVHRR